MLRRLAGWVGAWLLQWAYPPLPAPEQAVLEAVIAACEACGLPRPITPETDVAASGKLPQVFYHAVKRLPGRVVSVREIAEALQ